MNPAPMLASVTATSPDGSQVRTYQPPAAPPSTASLLGLAAVALVGGYMLYEIQKSGGI